MSSPTWNTNPSTTTTATTSSFPSPTYAQILQELGAEALSPEFLDAYLPENRPDSTVEVKQEAVEPARRKASKPSMERLPNGNGGGGEINDQQAQQGQQAMYYASSQDPRMSQERFDRYNQMMSSQSQSSGGSSLQSYTTDQQQMSARTPEMINGAPQTVQQQLTLEQQQQLSARQAMMQRQYSSPVLTGRQPLNGADQRSKSSQNLMGNVLQQQRPQERAQGAMNGMTTSSQMAMNQGGFMSPTYAPQQGPNGQLLQRQASAQQLHAQQLQQQQQVQQQQQYQQLQQQHQGSSQQMTMSMQINSQMTQMNIQVGNQNTQQQQQGMMQNQQQLQLQSHQQQPPQYSQQQLQQMQQMQGQGQPQQVHTAQQAQTLQQMQQSQMPNGQYTAYSNQMGMGHMGQGTSTNQMMQQQIQLSDQQQLQLEQARLIRQRHPHLSQQPRSVSMGSLPLGQQQQQPPQYQYPYGQSPGLGPRPNGMNPFTANGTPVPANWLMAYQTEMPPAFLNHYHPGKAHPYFDHTRRNLQYPYPLGTKDLGDRPGEPFTFGFLPDSIYYNPANDRRATKGNDAANNFVGPSTSKASPKKRGAGALGGAAAAKKQRRTNSDQADDVRFVQPYPPTMTTQPQMPQQRLVPTSSTASLYASSSGQSFDGFASPTLPMQQQQQAMIAQPTPHMQLQRQMSAPAYSGLAQSAQDAMQNARQQQALANAQAAQYAAQQQQQQGSSSSGHMTHDGYQSPTGEVIYSEIQWRGQYTQQQQSTPTASTSQQSFRSPQPTPQSFNNGAQQPQQSQQPGSNEQMYWNQQQ